MLREKIRYWDATRGSAVFKPLSGMLRLFFRVCSRGEG
jgi:hypothetical protein